LVRCVIIIPQLINQELPDNGWCFAILEPYSGDCIHKTLKFLVEVPSSVCGHLEIYLSNEIFGKIREIVRFRDIGVCEKILIRIFWLVTVSQEELEEVE
jgi:hypothetical protein